MSVVSGTVFHTDRNGNIVPYTKLHNRPLMAKKAARKMESDKQKLYGFNTSHKLVDLQFYMGLLSQRAEMRPTTVAIPPYITCI